MRVCPHCGYENDDTSDICLNCDRDLPPQAPLPEAPAAPEQHEAGEATATAPISLRRADPSARGRQVVSFILGIAVGLVPAIIFAIGTINSWGTAGCFLFVVVLVAMGICLSQRESRTFGYGLLAAAVISPIIVAYARSVSPFVV
jgi:hypothetical protein